MRIGLFGGSFNPVHLGHILVAQAALEEFGLDRVVFVPAAQSPFKPGVVLAPGEARERWLRLALAGMTRCEVDRQELDRGGVSYTIETVRAWQAREPGGQLYYLIGGDHVAQLPRWRDAAALAAAVEFLVIPRPGEPQPLPGGPFRCHRLRGFPLALSASQVRERVQQGLPVEALTGPHVAEAIRNSGLYL